MFKYIMTISLTLFFAHSVFSSETLKGAKKDIETFKTEMNVKLEKVEKELMLLKAKAKNKGSEIEQKTANELENTRMQLKKELSEIKDDSHDGWSKLKSNLAESFDKLNTKVQKALKN